MGAKDLGAKTLYSNPDIVKDLLRFILQDEVALLDLESLQTLSTTHIHMRDQQERYNDIFWVIKRTDGVELYLPIMIEHQSDNDGLMPLRINTYIGLALEEIVRNKSLKRIGSRFKIPLVLPIVIYNGDDKWRVPTSLAQLRDPDFKVLDGSGTDTDTEMGLNSVTEFINGLQPNIGYYLIDVKRLVLKLPLQVRENLAEIIFKLEFNQGLDELYALMQTVLKMTASDMLAGARIAITSWLRNTLNDKYLKDTGTEIPDMEDLMELKNYLEERTLTWPEMYFRNGLLEGKSEGKAEGLAEGLAEGRIEGQSTMLINQLMYRFGNMPDSIISRIKNAQLDEIQAWSLQLLEAKTLDDVFK